MGDAVSEQIAGVPPTSTVHECLEAFFATGALHVLDSVSATLVDHRNSYAVVVEAGCPVGVTCALDIARMFGG